MWYINFLTCLNLCEKYATFSIAPSNFLQSVTFSASAVFQIPEAKFASKFTKIVSLINVDIVVTGPCFDGI